MLPLCADQGIAVLPWSPLARGRLTRDWNESSARLKTDETDRKLYSKTVEADRRVIEAVAKVSKERGIPRAQVALAWLLSKPVVTSPIIGASKPGHLDDAVAALDVRLTEQEIETLEAAYIPHAPVGFG